MEIFVLDSMIYFNDKGWDVSLVCNFENNFLKKIPDGIKAFSIPMKRSYNPITGIKAILKLYRLFRSEKFDIVRYGTTNASLYGSIASFLARVPNRVYLHWGRAGYKEKPFIESVFLKSMEKLICNLSTHIRPVSPKNLLIDIKDGLYKMGKGKVVGKGGTVGVDFELYDIDKKEQYKAEIRQKHEIGNDAFVFGFVGRILKTKGIIELLEAFKMILEKNSNTYLLIIGPKEHNLTTEIIDWSMNNPAIIYTGKIKHNDMPKYLSFFDVLVHPTYAEGFGMVLQEAMAMEIPIITTDIPGPSEVIEDGVSGVLVPPKNTISLSVEMENLIKNGDLRRKFGENGRIRALNYFNRPKMIENIFEDMEDILNSPN